MNEVTQILERIQQGEGQLAAQLLPLVYDDLRRLAAARMANEAPGNTLNPTALVHEAYLRLIGPMDAACWKSRGHFFAAAAEAMRRILVEQVRRKRTVKHGGGLKRTDADLAAFCEPASDEEVLAIDEALEEFAKVDPVKAELVKLRYFAGLTVEEAADALSISVATAKRYWAYSRAWLFQEISGENSASSEP